MKIARDIPRNVQNMMDDLSLTRRYNNMTGASLTHRQVGDFGYIESLELELAMEMLTGD